MMSVTMGWTREHKTVEFVAKTRVSYRNRCFSAPIRLLRRAQVARSLRSKAPNLRGEQSRATRHVHVPGVRTQLQRA